MATYAVGDVQGCYEELCRLLEDVSFDPAADRLWFLGDLVNRGPDNLAVMRLVLSLGDRACAVLGNHDLHFLAVPLGGHRPNRSDTFQDLLDASERDEIISWYCRQPLFARDEAHGAVLCHAGIPHLWSLDKAARLAKEVEAVIASQESFYFEALYGNEPPRWSDDLEGMPRLRSITNYFTRMRLMSKDGTLDFSHKGALTDAPPSLLPWYELRKPEPDGTRLLFGHWAALEGHTGRNDIVALDTGCVWGRSLTALCLETQTLHQVPAIGP